MLTIKIKPIVYTAQTKEALLRKILNNASYRHISGHGLISVNNESAILYNVEKINKKTIQHKYKTGEKKGQTRRIEVVSEKVWKAHVYTVPVEIMKYMSKTGVKITQHSKHYTVKKV